MFYLDSSLVYCLRTMIASHHIIIQSCIIEIVDSSGHLFKSK